MLSLVTANQILEILLEAAPAENNPSYIVTCADSSADSFTEGNYNGILNGVTPVTVCPAPGTGIRRVIKSIIVYNNDILPVILTLRLKDGTDYRIIEKLTLDSTLSYTYGVLSTAATQNLPADYTWVRRLALEGGCSGLISSQPISEVSNLITKSTTTGCVDVKACQGFYNDHSGVYGHFGIVDFPGELAVPYADYGINHVAVHKSGVINVSTTRQNVDDHVYLGYFWIYDAGTYEPTVDQINNSPVWATHLYGRLDDLIRNVFKSLLMEGCVISEKYGYAKELWMTEGRGYSCGTPYTFSQIDTFEKHYLEMGIDKIYTTNLNHVDTTNYNDPSDLPALKEMTTDYWKKDLIRLELSSGLLIYQYGNTEYATEDEATIGPLPITDTVFESASIFLATIICKKDDASVADRIHIITPNLQRIFGFGTKGGSSAQTTAEVISSLNKRYVTDAQLVVIGNTSGTNTGNETAHSMGGIIASETELNPPVGADLVPIIDISDAYAVKNITYDHFVALLKTYFDTIYTPATAQSIGNIIAAATTKSPPADTDIVGYADAAAGNIIKKATWTQVKAYLKTYYDTIYTLANLGGVPTTRTVNGHALSGNISVTAADVDNGTAQWNANKINDKTFPAMGSGDDQKYPMYNHATSAFIMSTPAGGGGGYDAASSVLNANFVLSNSSTEQNAFPAGQVTLAVTASTYRFHGMYLIGTGTTSKTTAMGFTLAGGAAVSSFEYTNLVWLAAANAITTTQSTKHTSDVAAAAQDGGGAYARVCMRFQGIARFTTGGTITLRLKFSVAPGTTCQMLRGSYIEFVKLGDYDYIKTGTWT